MKNILRKSIIIFEIIVLLIISLVTTVFAKEDTSDAVLQEQLGSEVIRFARAFVETANQYESGNVDRTTIPLIAGPKQLVMYGRGNSNGWTYEGTHNSNGIRHRETGYKYFVNGTLIYAYGDFTKSGTTTEEDIYAYGASDKLCFDCSYFASFIYSYSCGKILAGYAGAPTITLVGHYRNHNNDCNCGFEYVGEYKNVEKSGLKPGDIIVYEGHVMLFESYEGDQNNQYPNGFRKVNIIDCGYSGIKCAMMSYYHAQIGRAHV